MKHLALKWAYRKYSVHISSSYLLLSWIYRVRFLLLILWKSAVGSGGLTHCQSHTAHLGQSWDLNSALSTCGTKPSGEAEQACVLSPAGRCWKEVRWLWAVGHSHIFSSGVGVGPSISQTWEEKHYCYLKIGWSKRNSILGENGSCVLGEHFSVPVWFEMWGLLGRAHHTGSYPSRPSGSFLWEILCQSPWPSWNEMKWNVSEHIIPSSQIIWCPRIVKRKKSNLW